MKKYCFIALLVSLLHLKIYAQLKIYPYSMAEGRYNLKGDVITEEYKPTAPNTSVTFDKNYIEIDVNNKQSAYYWVKQTKELHDKVADGIEYDCKDKHFNTVICTIYFELKQTTSWIYFPEVNDLYIYRSKSIRIK